MPADAQILTVQVQHGVPCLWALVTPDNEPSTRVIEIFGTGHPVNENMSIERVYIGTFQLRDGALVFHAFEYTGV